MSNNQSKPLQSSEIKQLISEYVNENIDEIKNLGQSKDNSFVFLENGTLHMIINSIIKHLDTDYYPSQKDNEIDSTHLDEISTYIDTVMEDDKKAFDDVIRILKENS